MNTHFALTPARLRTLVIGMPLTLVFVAWGALGALGWLAQGSYVARLGAPVPAGAPQPRALSLTTGDGDVVVRAVPAGGIAVSATVHYWLLRPKVSWTEATGAGGPALVARSGCPDLSVLPCRVDLSATVPPDVALQVTSAAGNVQVTGLAAPARLESGAGNVEASGLAAPSVSARSGAGNVVLRFAAPPADATVRSGAGNVDVMLPPGPVAYHVQVHTGAGTAVVTVPTDAASTHRISATSGAGNISITTG